MNADYNKIKEALLLITKEFIPYTTIAKVISVDELNFTCTVSPIDNLDIIYENVRLTTTITPTQITFPSVDSLVFLNWLDENTPWVANISQIDKVQISNSDHNLRNILTDYVENLHSALMNASYKTPSGPSAPIPINELEFVNAKNVVIDQLNQLLK